MRDEIDIPDGGEQPLLRFEGIEKSFFGVRVLREVSFDLREGHVLGLVGENGAGKSTLMNILGGNLRPDAGRMTLAGRAYAAANPKDAANQGIAFIHQELNLFPNLSIAENLFLTAFPRRRVLGLPLIDTRAAHARAEELLAQVDLHLAPATPVESLSAGERQLVEIARALSIDARIILFDEPTTSLTDRETERLFALITRLRERGLSMIYISHILGDVFRLCDDLVVLRDGEVVAAGPAAEFTPDTLISHMVGRPITQLYPPRSGAPSEEVVLDVSRVSQPGIVRDVSLQVCRGEVVGIAGLMGSGRSELARILFGLDPHERGEIRVNGVLAGRAGPRERIRRGMAFLTEDRRADGLCMEASIADNIALVSLPSYARWQVAPLDGGRLGEAVAAISKAVRLSASSRLEQPAKSLSGGNQQKAVLAKWLLGEPSVLILDEPTRGIDVGAKAEVYHLVNELAGRGAGVLMISSEIEELVGLCDRILVMRGGEIVDRVERGEFDRERILRSALQEASA